MTENEFYMLVGGTLGKREKKVTVYKEKSRVPHMWNQSNLTSLGVDWPQRSWTRRGQQVYGGFAEVCREAGGEQQRSTVVMFDACLGCVWHRCWWQGKHKPGLSPLLLFLAPIWRSQVPTSVASRPHGTMVYLLPWGVWGWWDGSFPLQLGWGDWHC